MADTNGDGIPDRSNVSLVEGDTYTFDFGFRPKTSLLGLYEFDVFFSLVQFMNLEMTTVPGLSYSSFTSNPSTLPDRCKPDTCFNPRMNITFEAIGMFLRLHRGFWLTVASRGVGCPQCTSPRVCHRH